jgi:hypothetical protein
MELGCKQTVRGPPGQQSNFQGSSSAETAARPCTDAGNYTIPQSRSLWLKPGGCRGCIQGPREALLLQTPIGRTTAGALADAFRFHVSKGRSLAVWTAEGFGFSRMLFERNRNHLTTRRRRACAAWINGQTMRRTRRILEHSSLFFWKLVRQGCLFWACPLPIDRLELETIDSKASALACLAAVLVAVIVPVMEPDGRKPRFSLLQTAPIFTLTVSVLPV